MRVLVGSVFEGVGSLWGRVIAVFGCSCWGGCCVVWFCFGDEICWICSRSSAWADGCCMLGSAGWLLVLRAFCPLAMLWIWIRIAGVVYLRPAFCVAW